MLSLPPLPSLGSTNWSPWATGLQAVVAESQTLITAIEGELTAKAALGHTHDGSGGGSGGSGFIDGGSATSTFSDLIIDGGSAA